MNQTRAQSLAEALLNTFIGFLVSIVANMLILPLFGLHISVAQDFAMVSMFTVLSVVRSYALRRWCNAYLHRVAAWLVGRLA